MIWHCKRVDELAGENQEYQQKVQRCIERIEELLDVSHSWTHKHIYPHTAIDIIKEEMGCEE